MNGEMLCASFCDQDLDLDKGMHQHRLLMDGRLAVKFSFLALQITSVI